MDLTMMENPRVRMPALRGLLCLALAGVLAGLAPGLEFYSVLAANIAVTPGTGVVQTGPIVPVTGPSALGNGTGLAQSDLGAQAAGNLQGRSLSGNLPGAFQPGGTPDIGSVPSGNASSEQQQSSLGSAKVEPSALPSASDREVAQVRSAGRENLPSQTEVSPAVVQGTPVAASHSAERLAQRGKQAEEKVLALAAAFQSQLPSQAVPSAANGIAEFRKTADEGADSPQVPVQVFITRAGHEPEAVALAELGKFLAADPALKSTLNKIGRFRVVLSKSNPNGGLSKADTARIQGILKGFGITAKLEVENISIDWAGRGKAPEAVQVPVPDVSGPAQKTGIENGRSWRALAGAVAAPFRELAYLARTLGASFTLPALRTLVTGLVVKFVIPMAVLKQVGWMADYNGYPVALALVLGLNIALGLFHGVFVNTWANFQNTISKQRGLNYQTFFNLVYGQLWGVLFRFITWSAGVKINGSVPVPPWTLQYLADVAPTAGLGSFFGTLGFLGVNTLYNNGRLKQWQRDLILLLRDLAMTLSGYFLASGSRVAFWLVFSIQQAVDLGIYLVSRRLLRYPVLYIADAAVAATLEFQSMYPVGPGSMNEESPLKQAWKSLLGSPFVKPVVWLVKKIRDLMTRKK